jgi:N-methylhydantoinase A
LLRIDQAVELRYSGQSSELRVPVSGGLAGVVAAFHAEHQRRFGYRMPDRPVEIVSARMTALAPRPSAPAEQAAGAAISGEANTRPVWFAETGFVETPVLSRESVGEGVTGPAIIEQMDTTTVVPPGWTAHVDTVGNLLLRREDIR